MILVPPPLYYAAGLAAGMAIDHVVTLPIGARPATAIAGALITAAGAVLAAAGVVAVIRHRTTIVPHHAARTLITAGPYRLSRNPMYTGLAVVYPGLTLLLGSWWPLALWPLAVLAVRWLVIRYEEDDLTGLFGEKYLDYRSRVRRWL
ncbi:Protein-S-isoprenylcysteine O-methyltransferase [Actinoplanes sp. SE50]|uniref:methyltransferase family protein n=1 Tax=unclassified Actinoplanes TaxID=2626549 RepID=UPI00023EC7BC|nr:MULTISPECIES: isoprenylcysteine carboxylmethyltransferase family protein [unclassified Actinoplanes]AEV84226.1 Protein-S-isoprenylcysteine O-methyltransferase [Actinoplanes sp. SE50/110]ATO82618.1 Protein-S-isoprenylcysteine O-methyltransferase [Actinoplanes sp. SE50]SLM00025.1 protein-S-isoprenylcysteine O-methyltransferase [Actinoplanes sp. SE50/110]